MAVKISVKLEGFKEFGKKLQRLPNAVANKVVRKAMRAGTKIIHQEAKNRIPALSGTYRRGLKVRAMRRKRGRIGFTLQTQGGDFSGKAFYAPMVEFGHKAGSRKLGANRAQVKPHPYLRESFEAKSGAALEVITQEIRDGIVREAKK